MKTPTEIDEKVASYIKRAYTILKETFDVTYKEKDPSVERLVEVAKLIQREELAEKKL